MDLEGMVCKRKDSPYRVTKKPSPYWIKVKNPRYSQAEGRNELFDGLRGLDSSADSLAQSVVPENLVCIVIVEVTDCRR